VNKFRRSFSLVSLLMVVLLLTGCIQIGKGKEEFKLTFTVTLEEGGEGKVDDVTLKVGEKVVPVEDGKAEATVAKGEVTISATLDGYKAYEEKVNVTKNEKIDIHLELVKEEEEVTEEDLVEAVQEAAEGDDEEAFLDALLALQDAGLVTGVVEEYAKMYLEQARDYDAFTAQSNAPFMRNAKEIQENVIDPVNAYVPKMIAAVNNAKTLEAFADAFSEFREWELLEDPEYDFSEMSEEELLDTLVIFVGKYSSNTVADLQNIYDGAIAKMAVDKLFHEDEDGELELAEGKDQDDIDGVAELVAELGIPALKTELQAMLDKAQGFWDDKVLAGVEETIRGLFLIKGEDNVLGSIPADADLAKLDHKKLTLEVEVDLEDVENAEEELDEYEGSKDVAHLYELIALAEELAWVKKINDDIMDVGSFVELVVTDLRIEDYIALTGGQRDELADRLVAAWTAAINDDDDDFEGFESKAEFIEAVVAEVADYLDLIGAVNAAIQAKDKMDLVAALKDLDEDYAEWKYHEQLPVAESMISDAPTPFVPFETIDDILDAAGLKAI